MYVYCQSYSGVRGYSDRGGNSGVAVHVMYVYTARVTLVYRDHHGNTEYLWMYMDNYDTTRQYWT